MLRDGIPLRHPGGRTPFLRRWRTRQGPAHDMSATPAVTTDSQEQPASKRCGRRGMPMTAASDRWTGTAMRTGGRLAREAARRGGPRGSPFSGKRRRTDRRYAGRTPPRTGSGMPRPWHRRRPGAARADSVSVAPRSAAARRTAISFAAAGPRYGKRRRGPPGPRRYRQRSPPNSRRPQGCLCVAKVSEDKVLMLWRDPWHTVRAASRCPEIMRGGQPRWRPSR